MTDRRLSWMAAWQGALALLAGPALADQPAEAPPAADAQQGVIVFTPADFAASRPNTAVDLLNRLPGFTLDTGETVRGFAGAAGNVLVDGQRPTIKTESLTDYLARITIGQIERVELARAAEVLGVPLLDHIVIGADRHASMFEQGLLERPE